MNIFVVMFIAIAAIDIPMLLLGMLVEHIVEKTEKDEDDETI